MLVLTATADALVNYTGFAIVLFLGMAVVALFVLRRREPDAPRPFRALGLSGRAGDLRAGEPGDSGERAVSSARRQLARAR